MDEHEQCRNIVYKYTRERTAARPAGGEKCPSLSSTLSAQSRHFGLVVQKLANFCIVNQKTKIHFHTKLFPHLKILTQIFR